MELFELIKKRRSIRKYDPAKPITDEQVNKILEAAIWAPSAGNTQCWRFFVVRNPEVKEELAVKAGHQPFINDAPVVIVVCADLNHLGRSYGSRGRETYAIQDTAAAIENMLLTITDMGLSTCWIGAFDEEKAVKILRLPDGFRPLAMLPIAYSVMKPTPPPRKPLTEVVTRVD